jgi:hypothetical protein
MRILCPECGKDCAMRVLDGVAYAWRHAAAREPGEYPCAGSRRPIVRVPRP